MADPKWQVKLKDGRTYIVENPTQPTPEEVQAELDAMDPTDLASVSQPAALPTLDRAPSPIPKPSEFEQDPALVDINVGGMQMDPDKAINALPAVGGTVGGIGGAIGGGAVGSRFGPGAARGGAYAGRVMGSGGGASLGEWMRQDLLRRRGEEVPEGGYEIIKEGLKSAGLDAIAPGLKVLGKGAYGAAMRNMPQGLLAESPQLLERGLAERIPATFSGAQKATARANQQMQEAVLAGGIQQRRGAGGMMTRIYDPVPEPVGLAQSEQMRRVSQMATGAATAAREPEQGVAALVGKVPYATSVISGVASHSPMVGGLMAALETGNLLRRKPGLLSGIGIGANELGAIAHTVPGQIATEALRYWEVLKQLGGDDEPGAPAR